MKEKILSKYDKIIDFLKDVSKIADTDPSVLSGHLYGTTPFTEEEKNAIASLLDIDPSEVTKMNKDERHPYIIINMDALYDAENKKGITPSELEKALGLTSGKHKQWQKGRATRDSVLYQIAKYLEIKPDVLIAGYKDNLSKPKADDEELSVSNDNVTDRFRLVRNNQSRYNNRKKEAIVAKLNELTETAEDLVDTVEDLMMEISELWDELNRY